ncbi:MAG: sn-glycerol-3-phosphate ABC transporter ATP-binding protein UgpC [Bauldia sp.]
MAEIKFEGVSKVYGDGTVAVDRLDLEMGDGEFVVLVGPSGCGKTTALRMLAGLEQISAGTITIGDRIVNDLEPGERDIAMVFQNYALYPHMSVRDNIAFSLLMQKRPKAEIDSRVRRIAEILGLSDQLDKKPAALSGGQRQRVAMGRAIIREPQAFLMDEPLSNLDANLRAQMRFEVARLQRELKATTLYVTHDQIEAMTMGDRVAILRHGVLQQLDKPQRVYDAPANLFVASFIGSPPMNIVQARLVQAKDGRLACEFGEQGAELPENALGRRPGLQRYLGRMIGVGLRPEHLEDAAFASGAAQTARIRGLVVHAEPLGSEVVAHVELAASPVVADEMIEVVRDVDSSMVQRLETDARRQRAILVGRFDSASRVKAGETVEIAVDVGRLHFFDIDTGHAISETEAP